MENNFDEKIIHINEIYLNLNSEKFKFPDEILENYDSNIDDEYYRVFWELYFSDEKNIKKIYNESLSSLQYNFKYIDELIKKYNIKILFFDNYYYNMIINYDDNSIDNFRKYSLLEYKEEENIDDYYGYKESLKIVNLTRELKTKLLNKVLKNINSFYNSFLYYNKEE